MGKRALLGLKSIARFADKPLVAGIRDGYMYMAPALIIGSLIVALLNIPIPPLQNFLHTHFGDSWKTFPLIIHNATIQILSLTAVISLSYSVSQRESSVREGRVGTVYPVITAFICYIAYFKPNEIAGAVVSSVMASASSMFVAMVVAVISVKLLTRFCAVYERLVPERAFSYNGNAVLRRSFRMIVPVLFTVMIFAAVNLVLNDTRIGDMLLSNLKDIFQSVFMHENIGSVILIALCVHVMWFFGIHGGNAFLEAYNSSQQAAIDSGAAIASVSKEFFDVFVHFGGAGATLALVLVLLVFGEKNSDRKLAKGSLLPGLLNINEPIIFGLPIVLNPIYAVPFLLAPICSSVISFLAISAGLVPEPVHDIPWTMPIFFSGYLATGSIAGTLLQVVNFTVAFLIYLPFVNAAKERFKERYIEDYQAMAREMSYLQSSRRRHVMDRNDEVGGVARDLVRDIQRAITTDQGSIHLQYQPKCSGSGRVVGAEALLRDTHPILGNIAPPIIIALAEEAKIGNELGRWIINRALSDMAKWREAGLLDMRLSINISPHQLNYDVGLGSFIKDTLEKKGIPPESVEFELTENATIEQTKQIQTSLKELRDRGSSISIDDFGMGHSSLKYIFDYFANVVKIDISLTQGVTEGEDRRIVVRSILDLCRKLGVEVIAEGVETKEQLDIMTELGADYFQGWYFSKALKYEDFVQYAFEHGGGALSHLPSSSS